MERDSLSLMQAYLRSQIERSGFDKQKLDWFFEQSAERASLVDDGVHPLLDDNREPHYSRAVWSQAFATWALLDNKNPVKFVCDYYHALEKLGENSPPHVREYVKRSLAAPAPFADNPDQIFVQARAQRMDHAASSAAYHFSQNRPVSCFYKHQYNSENNHLRAQMMIQSYDAQNNVGCNENGASLGHPSVRQDSDCSNVAIGEPNFWTGKHMINGAKVNQDVIGVAKVSVNQKLSGINQELTGVTQGKQYVDKMISVINGTNKEVVNEVEEGKRMSVDQIARKTGDVKLSVASLAMQLFGPNEKDPEMNASPNEDTPSVGECNGDNKMMTQSQTSLDSTPSKASEADSCYQSLSSPLTDQEE